MKGMDGIPQDWRAYIGDGIKSICLTNGHGRFPQDCTELTACIENLLPVTTRVPHQDLLVGRAQIVLATRDDFSAVKRISAAELLWISCRNTAPSLYTIEGVYADVLVEFNVRPQIEPNGTLAGFISLTPHTMPEQKSFRLRWLLPEGWRAKREESLYLRRAFNFPQPRLHRVYADSR